MNIYHDQAIQEHRAQRQRQFWSNIRKQRFDRIFNIKLMRHDFLSASCSYWYSRQWDEPTAQAMEQEINSLLACP